MALLPLNPDELLSTTRSVRKRLDFDRPVERHLVEECVSLATQAPSGSNSQGWHFIVVSDQAKRDAIGELYKKAFSLYRDMAISAANISTGKPERDAQQQRVFTSADYLSENMAKSPYLVISAVAGRVDGSGLSAAGLLGSILPATWSFMLAARARGLGTCWTTLHLMFEKETAEVLGIPYDEISQVCLTPVAYTKGTDFKPAMREPLESLIHWDTW